MQEYKFHAFRSKVRKGLSKNIVFNFPINMKYMQVLSVFSEKRNFTMKIFKLCLVLCMSSIHPTKIYWQTLIKGMRISADKWVASEINGVANGPVEAPGWTSLNITPYTCTGTLYRCGPFCFLPGLWSALWIQKNEGLDSPRGGTRSAIDAAPLEMVHCIKEGVSNLTVDKCGVASSSL